MGGRGRERRGHNQSKNRAMGARGVENTSAVGRVYRRKGGMRGTYLKLVDAGLCFFYRAHCLTMFFDLPCTCIAVLNKRLSPQ